MARSHHLSYRLQRRLALHQALHDPVREARNRLTTLAELRRWQAWRLEHSFHDFLADPRSAAAARFFLNDVYGDRDFSRRDADIARVLPMMERLLPASLLETVADAIELGALTHAFDLRMAEALQSHRGPIDAKRYASAYRQVGHPRLRGRQIDLVSDVGHGLGAALRTPGLRTLLRLSRGAAQATGFSELQGFLERGVDAFTRLGDVTPFVDGIERGEREVATRLFAGDPQPFGAMPR
jgi:hypothetical protein